MKNYYNKNAVEKEFKVGDKVPVLLLMNAHSIKVKFQLSYKVVQKVGDLNYILNKPDRRKKTESYRIDIMRPYFKSEETIMLTACKSKDSHQNSGVDLKLSPKLQNSETLADLETKLDHLPLAEMKELVNIIKYFIFRRIN